MTRPVWATVRVTRRQAQMMAKAMGHMAEVAAYCAGAGIVKGTTPTERLVYWELYRRLIVAGLDLSSDQQVSESEPKP